MTPNKRALTHDLVLEPFQVPLVKLLCGLHDSLLLVLPGGLFYLWAEGALLPQYLLLQLIVLLLPLVVLLFLEHVSFVEDVPPGHSLLAVDSGLCNLAALFVDDWMEPQLIRDSFFRLTGCIGEPL
jgi:hypothetical protein